MSARTLFDVVQLGSLSLANRIVMAPLTRGRAGVSHIPNELMVRYDQRASAGLIVTEGTVVSEEAIGWINSPGMYTDAMEAGWVPVVNAVHQRGGRIFMQLWHCGRASHSDFHGGAPAVAPSAIAITGDMIHTPLGKKPHEVPRALETSELPRVVEDYRRAAERARRAGFDGVEIHGANGYLVDEFLQSRTNQRTDAYGGSVENRFRLLGEIVDAVSSVWSSERVGVRLSPNGVFNDMGSPDFREQLHHTVGELNRRRVGYVHVMDGLRFGFHEFGAPITLAETRPLFSGLLIGNCGYDQASASEAVASGNADMIAFGRPFISNPDLVERFRNGWPLAESAPVSDWYSSDEQGYTTFPSYQAAG